MHLQKQRMYSPSCEQCRCPESSGVGPQGTPWPKAAALPKSTPLPRAACIQQLVNVGLCRPSPLSNLRQLQIAIPAPELSMGLVKFLPCFILLPPLPFHRCCFQKHLHTISFLSTNLKVRVYVPGNSICDSTLAHSNLEESQGTRETYLVAFGA